MQKINAENSNSTNKLIWLDAVKVVAMIAIMTVHFNVQISEGFRFHNQIIPNFLFGDIYLGTFGVVLFFIAAGCGFEISYIQKGEFSIRKYYIKKFKSVYPMFWIAWICTCCINLFIDKKLPDAPIETLLYTFSGMDGFLHVLINAPFNFYTIGEWFLGCLILIYLIMPLIHFIFIKKPILTFISSLLVSFLCELPILPDFFSSDVWFLRRIPEIIFGMLLIRFFEELKIIHSLISVCLGFIVYLIKPMISHFTYSVFMCMCIFVFLAGLFSYINNDQIKKYISTISQYFYPVFLIHQYIIYTMMKFLDPMLLRKREIIILYISYLCIVAAGSIFLKKIHQTISTNVTTIIHIATGKRKKS